MANDISRSGSGSGALAEVPTLSPELRGIIHRTETIVGYGGDEGPPRDGPMLAAGKWIVPKWVPETIKAEARNAVPEYRRVTGPVQQQTLLRWLNVIYHGTVKPGGDSWDSVKPAYSVMLGDIPGACFTAETLRLAAAKFKFFPSCNEIIEMLTPYRVAIENDVSRLTVVATLPTEKPATEPERIPPTEEEKARVSEIMRGIRATLSMDNAGMRDRNSEQEIRDAKARREADFAYTMEKGRRMNMALDAAKAAGNERDYGRFLVPMDDPLHGDLRAKHGHPCPGYDIAPSNAAEKGDTGE